MLRGSASPELDTQAAVCELAACDSCHQRLAAARRPQSCFVGLLLMPAQQAYCSAASLPAWQSVRSTLTRQCKPKCNTPGESPCHQRDAQQGGRAYLSEVKRR